jgi:hypothetical protein
LRVKPAPLAAVSTGPFRAVIRDFWVVEDRQRLFEVRRSRSEARAIDPNRTRIVYLPRVRYIGARYNLRQLNDALEYRARAQHYVKPFFRKAQPSSLQLEIARRAGVVVPAEHAYVRGHYRGIERTHGQKVYRSRSALGLLFEQVDDLPQQRERALTDWFVFEQMVGVLLEKSFGFTIEHRSTRGKADYGIDILATKRSGDIQELWVVQCKCYKPSNSIGPGHIRELLGAIADLNKDEQTVRCGNGVHSITVSQKIFAEIRAGKEITLQGDGFVSEEGIVSDYWEFNSGGLGSIRVQP